VADRNSANYESAPVIWLTGISGSGKSTLAFRLHAILGGERSVALLDGDVVRSFFEGDLGYSRQERIANVKRIAFAAKMLSDYGVTVIVANIAPYYEVRDFIRRKLSNYIEIYLDASLRRVMERDAKGLYGGKEERQTQNVIGVDDNYDQPRNPDLVINTDLTSIDDSIARICELLRKRGLIRD
jgi:adenylylsulfate kinase